MEKDTILLKPRLFVKVNFPRHGKPNHLLLFALAATEKPKIDNFKSQIEYVIYEALMDDVGG